MGIVLQIVIYVFINESTDMKVAVTVVAVFVSIPLGALLPLGRSAPAKGDDEARPQSDGAIALIALIIPAA